jgi:hypothetical protein
MKHKREQIAALEEPEPIVVETQTGGREEGSPSRFRQWIEDCDSDEEESSLLAKEKERMNAMATTNRSPVSAAREVSTADKETETALEKQMGGEQQSTNVPAAHMQAEAQDSDDELTVEHVWKHQWGCMQHQRM